VSKDGSYSVSLAAGDYTVTTVTQTLMVGRIHPSTVSVTAGQSRTVDFQIDTGIR
jgi:hypothetical protein